MSCLTLELSVRISITRRQLRVVPSPGGMHSSPPAIQRELSRQVALITSPSPVSSTAPEPAWTAKGGGVQERTPSVVALSVTGPTPGTPLIPKTVTLLGSPIATKLFIAR